MTTKEIEHIAYKYFWKRGIYMCYEVAVPYELEPRYHRDRVDMLMYEKSKNVWKAFEIKVSVSDFHSSASLSWIGNYNYYLVPKKLYDKVKDEIPKEIGCWIVYESGSMECIKKPKKQELKCKHENLMFSLMQGLSREYKKYRKILEREDKKKKNGTKSSKQ